MKKIIILLTLILFLLSACKTQQPVMPVEPVAPAPEAEEPIVEEIPSEEPLPTAVKGSTELLTELKCVDGKINAVVKNPLDRALVLAKDIKIMVNGLIVIDPVCDSMTIEPGMTVFCQDIKGHYRVRDKRNNEVKLNYQHTSVVEVVPCP